jgi:hypothetical protein
MKTQAKLTPIKAETAVNAKKYLAKPIKKNAQSEAKTEKAKSAIISVQTKTVALQKTKAKTKLSEKKITPVIEPPKKVRKKPLRPIGTAVFRGKKSLYDFKVFNLSETFEPIQAVFIISKRITDKRKRGHHSLICIGQTSSVIDEIKKHRKNRCLQKNAANTISILREESEEKRLKIADDLRAAHSISCSLETI